MRKKIFFGRRDLNSGPVKSTKLDMGEIFDVYLYALALICLPIILITTLCYYRILYNGLKTKLASKVYGFWSSLLQNSRAETLKVKWRY